MLKPGDWVRPSNLFDPRVDLGYRQQTQVIKVVNEGHLGTEIHARWREGEETITWLPPRSVIPLVPCEICQKLPALDGDYLCKHCARYESSSCP